MAGSGFMNPDLLCVVADGDTENVPGELIAQM